MVKRKSHSFQKIPLVDAYGLSILARTHIDDRKEIYKAIKKDLSYHGLVIARKILRNKI